MNSTTLAFLIILAFPAVLVLIAGTAYLLSLRWRALSDQAAAQSASTLANAAKRIAGLQRIAAVFAEAQVEPYISLVEQLKHRLNELDKRTRKILEAWQTIGDSPALEFQNPAQLFSQGIPDVHQRHKISRAVNQEANANWQRVEKLQELVQKLEAIPAETASRVAEASTRLEEVRDLTERLQVAGVQGEEFGAALAARTRAHTLFKSIPILAVSPSSVQHMADGEDEEETDQEKIDRESGRINRLEIQRAAGEGQRILDELEPILAEWLPRLREWDEQITEAERSSARLTTQLQELREELESAPIALETAPISQTAAKLSEAARVLQLRRVNANTGQLRAIERETGLIEKTVQETREKLIQASTLARELSSLIRKTETSLEDQAELMSQAEERSLHPLQWVESQQRLESLLTQLSGLGLADEVRSEEKINRQLTDARYLDEKVNTFTRDVSQALAQYAEITRLLDSDQIQQSSGWIREINELAELTRDWSADNWGKADNVDTLQEDIAAVQSYQDHLVPGDDQHPLSEADLPDVLTSIRRLAGMHTEEHARGDRVRKRLQTLTEEQDRAYGILTRLEEAARETGQLTSQVPELNEMAKAEYLKLAGDIEQIRSELAQPREGALQRKLQKAIALDTAFSRTLGGWINLVRREMDGHLETMKSQLASLDKLANIDDRPVFEARQLIERIDGVAEFRPGMDYQAALIELKRCALDRQSVAAAAQKLSEYIEPVTDAIRGMDEVHHRTRGFFHPSSGLSSTRSEWPPARQLMEAEIQEFKDLEDKLHDLRTERTTGTRLTREMLMIRMEMERLARKAQDGVKQSEKERIVAEKAEQEVLELQRSWMAISHRIEPDYPRISMAARDLSKRADKRVSAYRSQYQSGALDYDQVLAGLQDLADTLRAAKFPNGEDQYITIHS